jgi:hypothetical protein
LRLFVSKNQGTGQFAPEMSRTVGIVSFEATPGGGVTVSGAVLNIIKQ